MRPGQTPAAEGLCSTSGRFASGTAPLTAIPVSPHRIRRSRRSAHSIKVRYFGSCVPVMRPRVSCPSYLEAQHASSSHHLPFAFRQCCKPLSRLHKAMVRRQTRMACCTLSTARVCTGPSGDPHGPLRYVVPTDALCQTCTAILLSLLP